MNLSTSTPATPIHRWAAHAIRHGPTLVSALLCLLIAAELARAGVALFARGAVPGVQTAAPAAHGARAQGARAQGVDVQRIADAHLFGIAAPEQAADPSQAPPSAAPLVLAGTIATENPRHGFAIIRDGGPSQVYSVGDSVGGASLYSVYLDHVVLARGGAFETLKLPELLLGGAPAQRMAAAPSGEGPAALATARIRDAGRSRWVPAFDRKTPGKVHGYRMFAGRGREALARLGIQEGDLVTAVNGVPLDDPLRGQEALSSLDTASQGTLTVERAGQSMDIAINGAAADVDGVADAGGAQGADPAAFASAESRAARRGDRR